MIEKAITYAKEIFMKDASGHDFDHTMRVYRMAIRIAEEENADAEIVALAALLHDVDDRKLSPQTCQNKDRAVGFLRGNGLDEGRISRIVQIISEISFSSGAGKPSTLEGCCVQDADRLDALGAIGIARTFAFGGSRGRRIHDPQGIDKTTSIQHFYDKLLLLKDLMNTDTGRKMAEYRDGFLRQFLTEFYEEWEGVK
jgi:uncharacterized protein